MASSESLSFRRSPDGADPARAAASTLDDVELDDIELAADDFDLLLREISGVYRNQRSMETVLRSLQYPAASIPVMDTPQNAWAEIFGQFDSGIIDTPYRLLLTRAYTMYRANRVLRDLAQRYLSEPAAEPAQQQTQPQPTQQRLVPEQPTEPSHTSRREQAQAAVMDPPAVPDLARAMALAHVIVRVGSEKERDGAHDSLAVLGLNPRTVWATPNAVSFAVDAPDLGGLERTLQRSRLNWALIAPGQPDYLLNALFMEGPDGRRFRATDVPAQNTVGGLAGELVGQYPALRRTSRPTVVDQVQDDGQGRRLSPKATLHDAGVRDGDHLRVGFQATAGAVNPVDREEALFRARNQVVSFARAHPGITVRANSTLMPTEYEVEFRQRSFAPNPDGGGQPIETDGPHVVLIQLGAEFPMTPPRVYWLSQIFHPNVSPTYDRPRVRDEPGVRGLVCLGLLGEAYQPSMNFGELCQFLVDMAGFRNYGLYEDTAQVDDQGWREVRVNFYDGEAAAWAVEHQDRIEAIGGQRWTWPQGDGEPIASGYRNLIEVADG